eukprot:scaffold4057_cov390-Prasinococcus_capsulatus_cf.AAC.1
MATRRGRSASSQCSAPTPPAASGCWCLPRSPPVPHRSEALGHAAKALSKGQHSVRLYLSRGCPHSDVTLKLWEAIQTTQQVHYSLLSGPIRGDV